MSCGSRHKLRVVMRTTISFLIAALMCAEAVAQNDSLDFPYRNMPEVYPSTKKLTLNGDLSVVMLDGAHRFIENKIAASVADRAKLWKRDLSSPQAYENSVEENRKH